MILADVAAADGSGGSVVGAVAGAVSAVVVAAIAAVARKPTRRRRPRIVPEPPAVVTPADNAANRNLLNVQAMLEKDRAEFARYRDEQEKSENEFRRQVNLELAQLRLDRDYRDEIIQQVEQEYVDLQALVVAGQAPPFPARKPRPARPVLGPPPGTP